MLNIAMIHHRKNPLVTVDIIVEVGREIVLIERAHPPLGWALPGGFVDYGESVEIAARREAKEETSLEVTLLEQFHTYSEPDRDSRWHTISIVFIAKAQGRLKAADDARNAGLFNEGRLPRQLVFDHARIIADYFQYKAGIEKATIFS
jgi:ADP-ribose pyrophosphatase YjhB (NUDIX family)